MRKILTITPELVKRVKESLKKNGIRETARRVGISYYTAWCISKGKYDNDEPLQETGKWVAKGRCPITNLVFFDR